MYLVAIHVPIYLDGSHPRITTEWLRELVLLRDSLQGKFDPLTVVAPSLPADDGSIDQILETPGTDAGIELVPSFDLRCRARHYWGHERGRWLKDVSALVARADVVHAGLDDVFRPISYDGFREGLRQNRATIFVQDTDIVLQQRELGQLGGARQRLRALVYGEIFQRMCRAGVAKADLSLLKGQTLMSRYAKRARNAKEFQDTSYASKDVVPREVLDARLASLSSARPLRLVYCGRLVSRKGVDHSIRAVLQARRSGANVEFDIIGDGEQRNVLTKAIEGTNGVRLLGPLPYGPDLLKKLASYDALLFTPRAEDTPRMIFDGYAAGLPLIAYGIEFVLDRAKADRCAITLERDNAEGAARAIQEIDTNRQALHGLSIAAIAAADYHSADNWYRRRAQWTFEAVEKHRQSAGHRRADRAVRA
jgi:glycosyltransferase involved in cell wall biosynthesis